MEEAERIKKIPPYLFTIMDKLKIEAVSKGNEVIDLGMGNPDLPTPKHIVDELCLAAQKVANQRYSRPGGDVENRLKEAIASWYKERFGVHLNPETEVLPLIGSKEGIVHLSLAFLNEGDVAIVPTPAYPVHFNGVTIAGGDVHYIPLVSEDGILNNLKKVSSRVINKTKILFLSYPHNPTAEVVDIDFFKEIVQWARGKKFIVVSDLAYSDIVFDGYRAPSIMEVDGAKEVAVEFHTLSKSYNMAGWRLGFVVGNSAVLKSLAKVKSYIDFGIFRAVQLSAISALTGPQDCVRELVNVYNSRMNVFIDGLNKIGWKVDKPKATFYVWLRIPEKYKKLTSLEFAGLLVQKAGVVVAPGTGFGEAGEGYIRFALVENEERLKLAIERLRKIL